MVGKGWFGLYLCRYVDFRQLLFLTTICILFVSVVLVVFMVGCCDAVVTNFLYVATENNVGNEGVQALAQALENNSTLTTISLWSTC